MYTGVTAHHNAKRVVDYRSATVALERAGKTPTGRDRIQKPDGFPLGGHHKSVTWVRMREDGAIAFQLYETDVVTWHTDDSVEIENYGTTTTSGFAERFLPGGFNLHFEVSRRGVEGGDKAIAYRGADGVRMICKGDSVRFRPEGEGWTPDLDGLDAFWFPVTDSKAARALSKAHHLAEFEMWMSMGPMHLELEHECVDYGIVAEALLARDWRRAAVYLPLVKDAGAYGIELKPYPIATAQYQQHVTPTSLSRFRTWLYDAEGVTLVDKQLTMTNEKHVLGKAKVRALERAGVYGRWGWE